MQSQAKTSDMGTITLIEDEPDVAELLKIQLSQNGFSVQVFSNAFDFLNAFRHGPSPSLLIVDWMLPEMSGIELIREVRRDVSSGIKADIPILMLTAKVSAEDTVLGLETGADDYLTKPFDFPILLARIRALLRAHARLTDLNKTALAANDQGSNQPTKIQSTNTNIVEDPTSQLRVDPDRYEVRLHGERLDLTPSEFKLISALLKHAGLVLSRARLIEMIQGSGINVTDRTIDTHIFGLRKKLGECGNKIETVRGIGYRYLLEHASF